VLPVGEKTLEEFVVLQEKEPMLPSMTTEYARLDRAILNFVERTSVTGTKEKNHLFSKLGKRF
jgi:hypothetical protein